MEKTNCEMNVLANSQEPVVLVPPVVEVVQVQVALVAIPVEVRNVPVVVPVLPDRTDCAKYLLLHHPLNTLGIASNLVSKIP
jgi:hypothetical protein